METEALNPTIRISPTPSFSMLRPEADIEEVMAVLRASERVELTRLLKNVGL